MPGSYLMQIWVMVEGRQITFGKIKKNGLIRAGAEVIKIPSGAFLRVSWLLEKASAALFNGETFPKGEVEYWERWLKNLRCVTVSVTPEGVLVSKLKKGTEWKMPKNISLYFGGYPAYPRRKRTDKSLLLQMLEVLTQDDPAQY